MDFKNKYKKYKDKYLELKNQIGGGWKLKFDTSTGEPYYHENIRNTKIIGWSNRNNKAQKITISAPNSGWSNKDYEDYYNENTGDYNLKNIKTGDFFFDTPFYNDGTPHGHNASLLWEIKTPNELKLPNFQEFNIDIPIKKIEESSKEYQDFITNNNSQIPPGIEFESNVDINVWTGGLGGSGRDRVKEKIFIPNRFIIRNLYGTTIVNPILYLENVNDLSFNQLELIEENLKLTKENYEGYGTENEIISQNKYEIFMNKLRNNDPIWIYLSFFNLYVTENTNDVIIDLTIAYSDFLKPNYGKVVTCFIAKYYKEKYPDKEIKFILDDRTGGRWQSHGFEFDSKKSSHMTYNFQKGEKICKKVVKDFDFKEILYYDLI